MPTIVLQKTKFTFSILPLKFLAGDYWAKAEICIENENIHYAQTEKRISSESLEEWIFCMHRLLAGAYKREYNLSFDEAGVAIDFYPHTENGMEVSRKARRENDCVMAVRMLMRSKSGRFLGGVYSLLFHRADIEIFAKELRKEYDEVFVKRVHGRGKYNFAGVSPLGYEGCNYWYLDASNEVKKGDYVWVEMGSHNTRQIVYVDSVRRFTEDSAPYPVHRVKQVLGIATEEELKE
ncbi:MAG: hypothetical protein J6K86_04045 [Clostridia bacterium]|nr:hypothetical protein [Clostridia bacterium]